MGLRYVRAVLMSCRAWTIHAMARQWLRNARKIYGDWQTEEAVRSDQLQRRQHKCGSEDKRHLVCSHPPSRLCPWFGPVYNDYLHATRRSARMSGGCSWSVSARRTGSQTYVIRRLRRRRCCNRASAHMDSSWKRL